MDNLIDTNAKDKDTLALLQYIVPENKEEKLLENQHILKTPIVRNGKKATIGYAPDTWKTWE
ncbi:arsenate reductase family protein [uncultured Megasphaera sp.]|uniref:arsenate reductase family protein n=1 Tax=uncultured Megasphaera sp. TaxID=165188 RepID=UPI0034A0064A